MTDDTIVAISTALGPAAIAVIRLSGPNATALADRVVRIRRGRVSELPTHTLRRGEIYADQELIDQVLVSVMRAPGSYTGEDVVEISCHGTLLVARRIVELLIKNGARPAEPGEFTKRAFLNGKLDLTQAEAVMDVISARTDRARAAASRILAGSLSRELESVRNLLLEALAYVEAHLDFPEEDIWQEQVAFVRCRIEEAHQKIVHLLGSAKEGRILREGLRVAILGRPNVGKSSLLNSLAGFDRAIVTPIPGTTRDVLEETISVKGIPIILADTAGIRKARGHVEKLGIEKTKAALSASDLILHVVDRSRPLHEEDLSIWREYACTRKPAILVLNKADLRPRFEMPTELMALPAVIVSCKQAQGLDKLCAQIELQAGVSHASNLESEVFINQRHETLLTKAQNELGLAGEWIETMGCNELVAQQLRRAVDAVGEIAGKVTTDDLLDSIFSKFCIGK